MASTTFIDNQTTIYAAWLNDVNTAVYTGVFQSSSITSPSMICTGTASGTGFTNLINNTLSAPSAIGNATPNTGAFTTLSSTSLTTSSISGLTTPLSIAQGGIGLTSAGSSGAVLKSNGSGYTVTSALNNGTVQTASGTATYSSIPSYVKRITVMFANVGTNTNPNPNIEVQLGTSSGFQTSGYVSSTGAGTTSANVTQSTTAFIVRGGGGSLSGTLTLSLLDPTNNIWVYTTVNGTNTNQWGFGGGYVTMSGTVTQLQIFNSGGFSGGSFNILYE